MASEWTTKVKVINISLGQERALIQRKMYKLWKIYKFTVFALYTFCVGTADEKYKTFLHYSCWQFFVRLPGNFDEKYMKYFLFFTFFVFSCNEKWKNTFYKLRTVTEVRTLGVLDIQCRPNAKQKKRKKEKSQILMGSRMFVFFAGFFHVRAHAYMSIRMGYAKSWWGIGGIGWLGGKWLKCGIAGPGQRGAYSAKATDQTTQTA